MVTCFIYIYIYIYIYIERERERERERGREGEGEKAFGNEVASAFLTKRRCNPFDKEKKQFTIHETHGISASKMQEKKKQMNPTSCALHAN
jgi:hypothetical protein